MFRSLVLMVLASVLWTGAMGCSWVPASFCATTNDRPDDAVISGRIIGVDMDGIDLVVIDVLRGDEARDTIRIWDGTDFDCNGIFSMAASGLGGVDDSIIVVMPLITEAENTWDVLGDYRRPHYFGCITDIRIHEGQAVGYIAGNAMTPFEVMPYSAFVAAWVSGGFGCSDFLSIHERSQQLPRFQNPVHDLLTLTFSGNEGGGQVIRLLTTDGQEALAKKWVGNVMNIDMSSFAPGMYLLEVTGENGYRASARVMKL